ncbi:MAG: YjbH domain-containing protein [Cyclobacteriaceae bacterium]
MRLIFFFLAITFFGSLHAQNLQGSMGLLNIPSAELNPDKTLVISGSYLSKNYLSYGDYTYDSWTGNVNLTFLPFIELSFRYTGQVREISRENNNFPNRSPGAKIRLHKESKLIPTISLGIFDFTSVAGGGSRFFGSEYVVMTKNFNLGQVINLSSTLGYGFDILPAKFKEQEGFFYGFVAQVKNIPQVALLVDYDSRYWNTGIRLNLFNHLQILGVLREFKTLEGALSYRIQLK